MRSRVDLNVADVRTCSEPCGICGHRSTGTYVLGWWMAGTYCMHQLERKTA